MSSNSRLPKLVALVGAASAAALSSCTLPPDQAWRKIKDDGLLAYWSYEMDTTGAGTQSKPTGVPQATPQVAQSTTSPINQPGMLDVGKPVTAQSIASLPGFVRSPYTNPPRLVDVKGATPGSTMICPYTQRAFIIPADFVSGNGNTMVADTKPQSTPSTPAPAPAPTSTESSSASTKTETLPKVVINNRPTTSTPSSTASSQPKPSTTPSSDAAPVASNSPKTTPSTTSPAPAPKPVQDIPFGESIAGRPGFVNSPFAAKHQLVDVTGLPTGMEVKCPYTGKLFRVPPQDMASSKPAETAPLASPDEPKKK